MAAALTNFYQQRYDNYLLLRDAAQSDFTAASSDLKLALDAYQIAVDAGNELEGLIAATRTAMSAPNIMPSDIETLAEELRQLLISRRHNTAAVIDADGALKFAEILVESAETRLAELNASLIQAQADLAAAQQRQTHHDNWVSTDTEDAITVVRDLAVDLVAENAIAVPDGEVNPADVLAAATARIDADIPEVLRDRAHARAVQVTDNVVELENFRASIEGDLLSHGASSNGAAGLMQQRQAEYDAAESGLKNYALTSVSRYDLALSLLTSIGKSTELTLAETDRISALALAVDADEMTTEAALHDARAAVAAQKLAIQLAIVAARVADVNANTAADAGVVSAQADLVSALSDLDAAETAHTDEFATAVDLWEGAIPNGIWANLQSYDSAMAILSALSTSDAAPLTTAFTSAEDAFVAAATDNDNNLKLNQALVSASRIANQSADHISRVQPTVSLSAMRGDY
jgi:hypothetical protein